MIYLSTSAHWRRYVTIGVILSLLNFWPLYYNTTAAFSRETTGPETFFGPVALSTVLAFLCAVISCVLEPGGKSSVWSRAILTTTITALFFGSIFNLLSH